MPAEPSGDPACVEYAPTQEISRPSTAPLLVGSPPVRVSCPAPRPVQMRNAERVLLSPHAPRRCHRNLVTREEAVKTRWTHRNVRGERSNVCMTAWSTQRPGPLPNRLQAITGRMQQPRSEREHPPVVDDLVSDVFVVAWHGSTRSVAAGVIAVGLRSRIARWIADSHVSRVWHLRGTVGASRRVGVDRRGLRAGPFMPVRGGQGRPAILGGWPMTRHTV
jgi:hypothetical protein